MAQHSLRVQGRLQVVGKPSLSLTMDRPCRTVSAGNRRGRPCAVTASAPAFHRDAASRYWLATERCHRRRRVGIFQSGLWWQKIGRRN